MRTGLLREDSDLRSPPPGFLSPWPFPGARGLQSPDSGIFTRTGPRGSSWAGEGGEDTPRGLRGEG